MEHDGAKSGNGMIRRDLPKSAAAGTAMACSNPALAHSAGHWLIGRGCATTMYPTQMGRVAARGTLMPAGSAKVETATHEIGTGVLNAAAANAVFDATGMRIRNLPVRIEKLLAV